MNPGWKKSTWLWFNIMGLVLNFSGLLMATFAKFWLLIVIHCIFIYISQQEISKLMLELDKTEETL